MLYESPIFYGELFGIQLFVYIFVFNSTHENLFLNFYIINLPSIIGRKLLHVVGENIMTPCNPICIFTKTVWAWHVKILLIDYGRQFYYWKMKENIRLCKCLFNKKNVLFPITSFIFASDIQERAIMLFNRNLPTRCHKTSLRAFISRCIFNSGSNIEAGHVGR